MNEHKHDKDNGIGITCQDQIYGRIMEVCGIVNAEGIWKVHMDG